MGKVISVRWITRDEDLRQIKGGPISILTGKNLKTSPPVSSKPPKKAVGICSTKKAIDVPHLKNFLTHIEFE